MDWSGIQTAYLDLQRRRLGLPSREELAMKRAAEARAQSASESALETAGLNRDLTRARIAALPAEQELDRRYKESVITRNEREPQARVEPSTMLERIAGLPPEKQARLIKLNRELNPRPEGGSQPRTGWQPQYDQATGRLVGYYHPATETFRAVGQGNLPSGTRPGAVPAGEMEKRGMLQSMLSDAQRLQTLVGLLDKPTEAGKQIGYWAGREQDIRSSGALAPLGVEAPPESVLEMIHITDNISDMLLRARSGAQINEQEYARLRKLMPNPRTSPESFRANLSRFIVETNNIMSARQGGEVTQPNEPAAAPPAQPGQPIVQQNRRTGEFRHSLDGGATWLPGRP